MRLVLDWDGTVTERDTLVMVLERFGDAETCDRLARQMFAGEITLQEELDGQFAEVTASLPEVVAFVLDNVAVRPGLKELVRLRPLVISSGFHELIDPVLEREGVEVDLLANHVEARPDGWRIRWRDETLCATCGQPCKRAALPEGEGPLVYAGDGFSDRCAALAADRIFARRGLAQYLDERGVAYERFDDLHDIASALG